MPRKGINWNKQPLGKEPDMVLARKLDVAPQTVAGARRAREIPRYQATPRDSDLGELVARMGQVVDRMEIVAQRMAEIAGGRE